MKFPYLAPRTATGPIKLESYVDKERLAIAMDNARITEGEEARITPEFKEWHARQTRRLRTK